MSLMQGLGEYNAAKRIIRDIIGTYHDKEMRLQMFHEHLYNLDPDLYLNKASKPSDATISKTMKIILNMDASDRMYRDSVASLYELIEGNPSIATKYLRGYTEYVGFLGPPLKIGGAYDTSSEKRKRKGRYETLAKKTDTRLQRERAKLLREAEAFRREVAEKRMLNPIFNRRSEISPVGTARRSRKRKAAVVRSSSSKSGGTGGSGAKIPGVTPRTTRTTRTPTGARRQDTTPRPRRTPRVDYTGMFTVGSDGSSSGSKIF